LVRIVGGTADDCRIFDVIPKTVANFRCSSQQATNDQSSPLFRSRCRRQADQEVGANGESMRLPGLSASSSRPVGVGLIFDGVIEVLETHGMTSLHRALGPPPVRLLCSAPGAFGGERTKIRNFAANTYIHQHEQNPFA
jgi:hypothetical protein